VLSSIASCSGISTLLNVSTAASLARAALLAAELHPHQFCRSPDGLGYLIEVECVLGLLGPPECRLARRVDDSAFQPAGLA